jgi:hypothetical protein
MASAEHHISQLQARVFTSLYHFSHFTSHHLEQSTTGLLAASLISTPSSPPEMVDREED